MLSSDRFRVIIIGAGPVGLSTAIELGRRGLDCLVIEKNDRVGYAPRAKTTNVRTRTHLRRWGIADRLADEAPFGVEFPTDITFVTSLSGHKIATFENAFNGYAERNPLYPEHAQWIPQYKLEQVLRVYAEELPSVTLAFNTEFIGLNEVEGEVVVSVREENGQKSEYRAEYLVGADGARSAVREELGIGMSGTYGLSTNYNIVFRAPGLAERHGQGPAIMYWQLNDAAPSLIGPMDRDDVWFFMPTDVGELRLSDKEARDLIARSTGIDMPYEILSSDLWVASRLIADRYRQGRVFLAGDACHLHPPFGGYGMNMGVGDAVDLGWKLAATLQGWGGPALLDSYEIERRPVHQQIMEEAEQNHSLLGNQLWVEGLDRNDAQGASLREEARKTILRRKSREFRTLGAVLGYRYCGSPVIPDAPEECELEAGCYVPKSDPGALAPHFWLSDGTSLYDHFGSGFTLLQNGKVNSGPIVDEAQRSGIPLTIFQLPPEGTELYPARLTLIRPDQHVCWSGDNWKTSILDIVTGRSASTAQPVKQQQIK